MFKLPFYSVGFKQSLIPLIVQVAHADHAHCVFVHSKLGKSVYHMSKFYLDGVFKISVYSVIFQPKTHIDRQYNRLSNLDFSVYWGGAP
jgi:hypothetical protein